MANPLTFAYQSIAAGFCYLEQCLQSSNTDIMIQMPPFGADQWKEHFKLDVESPQIPQHLLYALEESCPFWAGKLKKQTHILCLAPDITTLGKLNNAPNLKSQLDDYKATSPKKDPYWFLITKEPIPGTKYLTFDEQKKAISQKGYDAPYLTEAAVATFAAKLIGKFKMFPSEGNYTKCYETSNELFDNPHIAVGSESHFEITVYTNDYFANGVAGVLR